MGFKLRQSGSRVQDSYLSDIFLCGDLIIRAFVSNLVLTFQFTFSFSSLGGSQHKPFVFHYWRICFPAYSGELVSIHSLFTQVKIYTKSVSYFICTVEYKMHLMFWYPMLVFVILSYCALILPKYHHTDLNNFTKLAN